MTRALFILPAIVLAGCLNTPPQPQSVDVFATGIEVQMSNRQTCTGPAPQPGVSWSGTLQGCDAPYPYRVTLDDRGNALRDVVETGFSAIGVRIAPVAEVQIDGPAGNTWRFETPPPLPSDD